MRRPAPLAQPDPTLPPYSALLASPDGGEVFCHVCGRGYRNLAAHALRAHGLGADAYREEYDLSCGLALVAPALAARHRARALAQGVIDNIPPAARGSGLPRGRPPGRPARLSARVARSEQVRGRW